jgi:hypothetical protein
MIFLAACSLAGCFDRESGRQAGGQKRGVTPGESPDRVTERSRQPAKLRTARCPADLSNCAVAGGTVLYVERVDPDGDGDAHFVLASREGITGPGISVIDVKRSLRPSPLPAPGARLSAAGPIFRGSYGQRQIEAIELHVARAR